MERTERFWDKLSNKFDKRVLKHFGQNYAWVIENTKKHLSTNDVVLDFACSTGIITIEMAGHVKEIHAIDISSKMIEAARIKASERKIENIDFAQSTIFDERHQRESFEVVLAFNILHLIKDTQSVVQRIHELLKPGGLFISSTECMGEKKTLFNFFLSLVSTLGVVPYLKSLKTAQLKNSIVNGGFSVIETDKFKESYFMVAKK